MGVDVPEYLCCPLLPHLTYIINRIISTPIVYNARYAHVHAYPGMRSPVSIYPGISIYDVVKSIYFSKVTESVKIMLCYIDHGTHIRSQDRQC